MRYQPPHDPMPRFWEVMLGLVVLILIGAGFSLFVMQTMEVFRND